MPSWGSGCSCAARSSTTRVAAASSLETKEFSQQSVYEWAAVVEDAGIADEAQLAEAIKASVAHFAPDVT